MENIDIIKRKAYRLIKEAYVSSPHFTYCVEFLDGERISKKDCVDLRLFLASIQDVKYEPITDGQTEHCIPSKVGLWALLGFRSGDAVLFYNLDEVTLPILFS